MKFLLLATAVALAYGGGQISLELWSCGRRSRLPDFNSLGSAHRSKMVETVNYPNRGWGFDETVGGRHFCHEFCARFRGRVTAPKSGTYQFSLSSDDGSKLFVDNALIINNDGLHGARRYTGPKAGVSAGQVLEFEVQFFERHGGKNVVLLWKPPGSGWVLLKGEAISPPPSPPPPNPPPPPPTTPCGYKVSSAGCQAAPGCGYAKFWINDVQISAPNGRGLNVVVVDPSTFAVVETRRFDTYRWGWAAKAFYEFLAATAEERPNFTVLVAVKDEAQNRAGVGGSQNVYAAMRKFLGAGSYAYPGPRCFRCSYALVARIDKSGGDLLISREATDRRTIVTANWMHEVCAPPPSPPPPSPPPSPLWQPTNDIEKVLIVAQVVRTVAPQLTNRLKLLHDELKPDTDFELFGGLQLAERSNATAPAAANGAAATALLPAADGAAVVRPRGQVQVSWRERDAAAARAEAEPTASLALLDSAPFTAALLQEREGGTGASEPAVCDPACVDQAPPSSWTHGTCEEQLQNTDNCRKRREGTLVDPYCRATCAVCWPCAIARRDRCGPESPGGCELQGLWAHERVVTPPFLGSEAPGYQYAGCAGYPNAGRWTRMADYSVPPTATATARWEATLKFCASQCGAGGFNLFSLECPVYRGTTQGGACQCANTQTIDGYSPQLWMDRGLGSVEAESDCLGGKAWAPCTAPATATKDGVTYALGGWNRGSVYFVDPHYFSPGMAPNSDQLSWLLGAVGGWHADAALSLHYARQIRKRINELTKDGESHGAEHANYDLAFAGADAVAAGTAAGSRAQLDGIPPLDAVSVALWVQPSLVHGQKRAALLTLGSAAAPNWLALSIEPTALVAELGHTALPKLTVALGNASHLTSDAWHHLALTWRAADGLWALYVDGLQLKVGIAAVKQRTPASASLVVGQRPGATGFSKELSFRGRVHGASLWDVPLTPPQVDLLLAPRVHNTPLRGQLARWPAFRHALVGPAVHESAPSTLPALNRTLQAPPPPGFDAVFDGSGGGYLLEAGIPDLGAFSVCAWVRTPCDEAGGCTAADAGTVALSGTADAARHRTGVVFSYADAGVDDALVLHANLDFRLHGAYHALDVAVVPNRWRHWCLVVDAAGAWRALVDGQPAASGTVVAGVGLRGGGAVVVGHHLRRLGAPFEAGGALRGQVHNLCVFSYALTDDQARRVRRELKDPPPDVKQWGHFRDRKQGTVKLVAPSTVAPPAPAAFPAAAYRAETTPRALQPLPWRFDNSR